MMVAMPGGRKREVVVVVTSKAVCNENIRLWYLFSCPWVQTTKIMGMLRNPLPLSSLTLLPLTCDNVCHDHLGEAS